MSVLGAIGASVIRQLAYVGGLTTQFWFAAGALPRILPLAGKRGRGRARLRRTELAQTHSVEPSCQRLVFERKRLSECRRFHRYGIRLAMKKRATLHRC